MGTILGLLKKIDAIDTDKICAESIEETKSVIEDKNREQLFSGETSIGTEIIPPYTPYTVSIKQQKGQPTDRVTLRDTGQFYGGLYVNVQGASVITESADLKSLVLKEKYGEQIFGLNDKFRIEYKNEALQPAFTKKMEEATGLKFR